MTTTIITVKPITCNHCKTEIDELELHREANPRRSYVIGNPKKNNKIYS